MSTLKTITVYNYAELSDDAKENVRQRFITYDLLDDCMSDYWDDVRAVMDAFGINDWEGSPWGEITWCAFDNSNFRGIKLRDVTGMDFGATYLASYFREELLEVFVKTGDLKEAFRCALNRLESDLITAYEYYQSDDDYLAELVSEYEFDVDGNIV